MGTKIDSYYMKSKLFNPKGSSWTNGHFVTTKIKNTAVTLQDVDQEWRGMLWHFIKTDPTKILKVSMETCNWRRLSRDRK